MPARRQAGADDAVRAILKLIRGVAGDHPNTTGGKSNKQPVRTKKKSASMMGATLLTMDGPLTSTSSGLSASYTGTTKLSGVRPANRNPMKNSGSIIVGGLGGAPVELPIGAEGTVLAVIGGRLQWVTLVQVGGQPNYLIFEESAVEYDLYTEDGSARIWV